MCCRPARGVAIVGLATFRPAPNGRAPDMPLRLTPPDNTFYKLFTTGANNLVDGVGLLRELVAAPSQDAD
jgi:hypothetical protein